MKRFWITLIACIAIIICLSLACVYVSASDVSEETVVESLTENAAESEIEASETVTDAATVVTDVEDVTESASMMIDSEAASEIVGIIEGSGTKAEAIIALAEKLGITTEEAEGLINSMLEVGDQYLGETKWWVGFKSSVEENLEFWVMAAAIAMAALALFWYSLSMRFKVASPVKRVDYTLNSEGGLVDTVKRSCEENSQALGKMMELYKAALENKAIYEKELLDKDGEILRCNEQIVQLKEARIKESKDMLIAAACNLRMLKLVIDRTAMPMTDKATIDLFYANGMKAIEAELSEEDFARLEKRLAMLDTVGGENHGQGQA